MGETMKNTIVETADEQVAALQDDNNNDPKDALKEAIEANFQNFQRQSMLLGAQTILRVVLEKIVVVENKPGKISMNDYKRLVKDLKNFCVTGLSRDISNDMTTELVGDDNNTKLMEETYEGNINESYTKSYSSN